MIPLSVPEIIGNEWKYIKDCLDTNWVSSAGKYVDTFEQKFSEYLNVNHAVATVNGTAALHLALKVLEIQPEDEIIVPSMTFIASVNPIIYVGAKPVFVDVCRDSYVMDVNKIEQLITEKTKAIMPVHLYGNCVDMEALLNIAQKYNLYVIEDATEALGTEYKINNKWVKAGTIGDIGCFSFNGNKLITTGGGGMLVTNSEKIKQKAKQLSTQAKLIKDNSGMYHEEIGYNFRLPNILAAMGVAQLEQIEEFLKIKRSNAKHYSELLNGIKGITLPKEDKKVRNCSWLYSPLIEEDFPVSRDKLIQILKYNNIQSRPFFSPIHLMQPYQAYRHGDMKVTLELSSLGINLPSSVGLKYEDIQKIVGIIKEIC